MRSPSQHSPGYVSLVDAKSVLQPYILPLIDAAKQAMSLFLSDPVVVRQASPGGRAMFLNDNFYAFAEAAFAHAPGVDHRVARGQHHLDVDGQLILRFKKMNAAYESRNATTRRSQRWNWQWTLEGTPDVNLPRPEMGYLLDPTGTRYEQLCVVLRGARVPGSGRRGSTAHWLWLLGGRPDTTFHLDANGGVNMFGEQVFEYSNYPI